MPQITCIIMPKTTAFCEVHYNVKPKIRNVVSTADLKQKVNVVRLADIPYGIYDGTTYGGRCGYIKTQEMDGRVTVFPSGKMISVGGRSIERSKAQLNHAKFFLVQNKMIDDVSISPNIRNIVATVEIGKNIPVDVLSTMISGAIYDPETFPGMILKGLHSASYLVFASGKIVIAGTKSIKELNTASFELVRRINALK